MHNMKWSDPLPISQGSAGKMFGESVISRKDSQSVSKASIKNLVAKHRLLENSSSNCGR